MTIDEIKRRAQESVEIMALKQQLRAGQVIIATMAKIIAKMEVENDGKKAHNQK